MRLRRRDMMECERIKTPVVLLSVIVLQILSSSPKSAVVGAKPDIVPTPCERWTEPIQWPDPAKYNMTTCKKMSETETNHVHWDYTGSKKCIYRCPSWQYYDGYSRRCKNCTLCSQYHVDRRVGTNWSDECYEKNKYFPKNRKPPEYHFTCDTDTLPGVPVPPKCEAPPVLDKGKWECTGGQWIDSNCTLICDSGFEVAGTVNSIVCDGYTRWVTRKRSFEAPDWPGGECMRKEDMPSNLTSLVCVRVQTTPLPTTQITTEFTAENLKRENLTTKLVPVYTTPEKTVSPASDGTQNTTAAALTPSDQTLIIVLATVLAVVVVTVVVFLLCLCRRRRICKRTDRGPLDDNVELNDIHPDRRESDSTSVSSSLLVGCAPCRRNQNTDINILARYHPEPASPDLPNGHLPGCCRRERSPDREELLYTTVSSDTDTPSLPSASFGTENEELPEVHVVCRHGSVHNSSSSKCASDFNSTQSCRGNIAATRAKVLATKEGGPITSSKKLSEIKQTSNQFMNESESDSFQLTSDLKLSSERTSGSETRGSERKRTISSPHTPLVPFKLPPCFLPNQPPPAVACDPVSTIGARSNDAQNGSRTPSVVSYPETRRDPFSGFPDETVLFGPADNPQNHGYYTDRNNSNDSNRKNRPPNDTELSAESGESVQFSITQNYSESCPPTDLRIDYNDTKCDAVGTNPALSEGNYVSSTACHENCSCGQTPVVTPRSAVNDKRSKIIDHQLKLEQAIYNHGHSATDDFSKTSKICGHQLRKPRLEHDIHNKVDPMAGTQQRIPPDGASPSISSGSRTSTLDSVSEVETPVKGKCEKATGMDEEDTSLKEVSSGSIDSSNTRCTGKQDRETDKHISETQVNSRGLRMDQSCQTDPSLVQSGCKNGPSALLKNTKEEAYSIEESHPVQVSSESPVMKRHPLSPVLCSESPEFEKKKMDIVDENDDGSDDGDDSDSEEEEEDGPKISKEVGGENNS